MTTLLAAVRERTPAPVAAATTSDRSGAGLLGLFLLLVAAPLVVYPMAVDPYAAPKLLFVVVGAFLLTLKRASLGSDLRTPALAWTASVTAATILGVQPWQSLIGRPGSASGLVLAVSCSALLLAGAGMNGDLRAKVPRFLVGSSLAAAVVGVVSSVWPGLWQQTGRQVLFEGAGLPPLGHPVYLGSLCAAGAAAAISMPRRRFGVTLAIVAVLVSGVAAGGKRTALIGLAAALIVAAMRHRLRSRQVAALGMVVVVTVGVWSLMALDSQVGDGARYDEMVNGTARDRLVVWNVGTRAWLRRPLTGWGPANTWGAMLSTETEDDARVVGRGWEDAHNLIVETAVTSGLLGLIALGWVGVAVARRAREAPPWALGAVAALAVHHLFQPVNVALTPLMFFLGGVCAATPPDTVRRINRSAAPVLAVLGIGMILAGARFGSTVLEANGRMYFTPGLGSLRAAAVLDPSSVPAAAALTEQLAIDAGRRPRARAVVRDLVARAVSRAPWDPASRLNAARVELVMGDIERAAWWADAHLHRFPYDAYALAYRAMIAYRAGEREAAERFLERSLAIAPRGLGAQLVWDRARGILPGRPSGRTG